VDFVGPYFGLVLIELTTVSNTNYPLVLGLLDSGSVGFGFAWFGLVYLQLSFVPLVWICFPGLECRVATLLNPFSGSLLWLTFLHCL